MPVTPSKQQRRADITPRLWPAWLAIGAAGLVAVLGAIGIYSLLTALLGLPWHAPPETPEGREQRKLLVEAFKAALGVAAGLGAVVALAIAYRRHRIEESQSHRDDQRLFTERFGSAAEHLGHAQPAVRLAGVHAMAHLADDWAEQRQTCIDVLCAYLRLPLGLVESSSESPDRKDAAAASTLAASFRAEREVRQTIVRLITDNLRIDPDDPTRTGWHGYELDFTGVVFDGTYDFAGARFFGGRVSFGGAKFSGGDVSFVGAKFSGGDVSFVGAKFSGGDVSFDGAKFSGGRVSFDGAKFSGGDVSFDDAKFFGGRVSFGGAEFSGGDVSFGGAEFSGGDVSFLGAEFSGGRVSFGGAEFSGGDVYFLGAEFSGGDVSFRGAEFSGGTVDLSSPASWNSPPQFNEAAASTPGLVLPSVAT